VGRGTAGSLLQAPLRSGVTLWRGELFDTYEKRKQQDDKKVLAAYHSGNKTADEIIAFIVSNDSETD
jgi:hypothetical protein